MPLTRKFTLTVLYDFIYFSVMKTTKSNAKNNTDIFFMLNPALKLWL